MGRAIRRKDEFAEAHSFLNMLTVYSFPGLVRYLLRLLVVEQEKPEKAGQNSDQGAEKSEPKWRSQPAFVMRLDFVLVMILVFLCSCLPLVVTPERTACPR
jgi:hypothetical protein